MNQKITKQEVAEDNKFIQIDTSKQINIFLAKHDMAIGGEIISEDKLVILKDKKDLKFIGTQQPGCYFIFSNLKQNEIPSFSKDAYKGYRGSIDKNGVTFRCLYNGKSQKVKERLAQHLFNSHTLLKIKSQSSNGKRRSLSGTGAMSLDSITAEEAKKLNRDGLFDPSKQKLKPVGKSIHPDSHLKLDGKRFLINGIDITEEKWGKYKFAICVIKTDSELGKILIEEAFAKKNGRPPLCRRHG